MKQKIKKDRGTIATPLSEKWRYAEAAKYLAVSQRTLEKWVKADAVPHYRIGSRVYFDEASLFKWIQSRKRGGE